MLQFERQMRHLGILAAGLMATACGLSFNPDLPQRDPTNGSGVDDGDGDGDIGLGGPVTQDPCSRKMQTGGAGGLGGGSSLSDPAVNPNAATKAEACDDDQ